VIAKEWNAYVKGHDPIESWQNKIRHIWRFVRGWARNRSGIYKKGKKDGYPSLIGWITA
jgi:hypothetical protein